MQAPSAARNDSADALVEALRRVLRSRCGRPVQRIETHISWILLDGEHAWKIKKPLRLGFLDFSRIDVRRHCCEEELRLNRRLAPSIYLAVVPVHGTATAPRLGDIGDEGSDSNSNSNSNSSGSDGKDADDEATSSTPHAGDDTAIEYVLCMKQFAPGALFSERLAAGRLEPGHVDRLASRLAAFQSTAPAAGVDPDFGDASHVRATTAAVLAGIESQPQAARAAGLDRWCEAGAAALAACFDARRADGRVREGHGDLHLSNLVVLDDDVTAFDCIEFDPGLRWIDVACDIAFITMDFQAHGRHDLAFRFLDRWLEASGDHAALAVLRYYEVYRALVRALVAGIRGAQDDAASRGGAAGRDDTPVAGTTTGADGPARNPDYIAVAQALAQASDPRLLITHGLSGSGKSFASARLLEQARAIRLRSDVERKRLFGLAALERSAARDADEVYAGEATRRTYASLRDAARIALRAGYPVIVDAAFLRLAEREDFRALAHELQVPFTILHCHADPDLLRERVRSRSIRGDDASEADTTVLAAQLASHDPLRDDERRLAIELDTGRPQDLGPVTRRWLAATVAASR